VGGVTVIMNDEDLRVMAKDIVDQSMMAALNIGDQKVSESTIYGQTLGQPLSGNPTYSMTALLHQAGRLPLLVTQRLAGWAIGDVLRMALQWWREEPPQAGDYGILLGDLKAAEIPKRFEMTAQLEINLPQDEIQSAKVGESLTQGADPLAAKEWVWENVLNIKQPKEMQAAIWRQQAANLFATQFFADQGAALQEMMKRFMGMMSPEEGMQGGENLPQPSLQGGEIPAEAIPADNLKVTGASSPLGIPPVMEEGGGGGPQPMPGTPGENEFVP